jgi:hypothetical protein
MVVGLCFVIGMRMIMVSVIFVCVVAMVMDVIFMRVVVLVHVLVKMIMRMRV